MKKKERKISTLLMQNTRVEQCYFLPAHPPAQLTVPPVPQPAQLPVPTLPQPAQPIPPIFVPKQ